MEGVVNGGSYSSLNLSEGDVAFFGTLVINEWVAKDEVVVGIRSSDIFGKSLGLE